MKYFLLAAIGAFLLCASTPPVLAETYYVSPTGDDNNNGLTDSTAFEHLNKADDMHAGGDSVLVLNGTYHIDGEYGAALLWIKSGSLGDTTVWVAPGDSVIIEASGEDHFDTEPWRQQNHGIFHLVGTQANPREYIKISGFHIRSHDDAMASGVAIYQGRHITIENNTFSQIDCEAISAQRSSHLVIDGNTIHDVLEGNNTEEAVGLTHVDSSLVINNYLYDIPNIALALNGDQSHDVTFARNRIEGAASDAIYISTGPQDCDVYGNIALDCGAGIVVATEYSALATEFSVSHVRVFSNIAAYCRIAGFGLVNWTGPGGGDWPPDDEPSTSHISFVNNTAYGNESGLLVSTSNHDNVLIQNNLLASNVQNQLRVLHPDSVTFENNLRSGVINKYTAICESDILMFPDSTQLFCSTDSSNSAFLKISGDSFARSKGSTVDASMLLDFRDVQRDAIPDVGAYEYDAALDCAVGTPGDTSTVHPVTITVQNPDGTPFDTTAFMDAYLDGGCGDRDSVRAPFTTYLAHHWQGGVPPDSTPDCSGSGVWLESEGYSIYPEYPNVECNERTLRVITLAGPDTLNFVAHAAINVPAAGTDLQDLIAGADSAAHIFVEAQEPFAPYDPIVMRADVRVTAVGDSVEISGSGHGSTFPVLFPSTSTSWARLEGFTISAGESTGTVVRLNGDGRIHDCTIRDNGYDPIQLVRLVGNAPMISQTRFEATNQSANASAIVLGNTTSATIEECWIEYWGNSTCFGIRSTLSPGVNVRDTVIRGPGTGIELTNSGTTGEIQNCTVDSTLYDGIATEGSGLTPKYCIVNNANLIGGSYYGIYGDAETCIVPDGVSGDTSNVAIEDPLFCTDAYTLRVDSFGNPVNNSASKLIGAFPVTCWEDSLTRTTSFEGDTLSMSSSPRIPQNKVLTFGPNTTLLMGEFAEPSIFGSLIANGTEGQEVVFRGATQTRGYWETLEFLSTTTCDLTYTKIEDAETAISNRMFSLGAVDSVVLNHCTFSNFEDHGIYLDQSVTDTAWTGVLNIYDSTIDMTGASGSGIWVSKACETEPGFTIDINGLGILGDASGDYGIYLNDEGAGGAGSAKLQNIYIGGLSTGTGICVDGYSPKILGDAYNETEIRIDNCKVGIELHGSESPLVHGEIVVNDGLVRLLGCTTGMEIDATSPSVRDVYIQPISGGTGILTGGQSAVSFLDVDITGGAKGIDAQSVVAHTFREGDITNYTSYGVLVGTAAYPDLGTSASYGNNYIYSPDTTLVPVKAKMLGSLGIIKAEYNYWGKQGGPYVGMTNVDYTPWHGQNQNLSSNVRIMEVPMQLQLVPKQNPCYATSAAVLLRIPPNEGGFVFEAFTVTGRKITEMRGDKGQNGGLIEVPLQSRGRQLASGIYFLRLKTRNQTLTHKVVLLP